MPRGLAAGVLATLPAAAGIPGTAVVPPIVFPAVVTTILVFAVGFPLARSGARRAQLRTEPAGVLPSGAEGASTRAHAPEAQVVDAAISPPSARPVTDAHAGTEGTPASPDGPAGGS